MKLQILPRNSAISVIKCDFHFGSSPNSHKGNDEFVSKLLDRRWGLSSPAAKINQVTILDRKGEKLNGDICFHNNTQPFLGESVAEKETQPFRSFYVVRDDILHPLVNGNKARKLDALLPLLEDNNVTDVVTCGGCQSAHTAAVGVSCAERGLKSHLLLRGEEPETLTGYNLVSKLYGNVVYVPRSLYANRKEMLLKHAESILGSNGSILWLNDLLENSSRKNASFGKQVDSNRPAEKETKVVIINEGAGDAIALPGVIRLIQYLSQDHLFGKKKALKIVVDAGTGTTAIGLALGAICLGLPWEITAIMLADKIDSYKKKEQILISEFLSNYSTCTPAGLASTGIVDWVERRLPRKFGNILKGEVQECQRIAQQTGILVDPIYTLAAWDLSSQLSQNGKEDDAKVVMIHTGGTLGMFGLAQRYKSYFQ